MRDLKTRLAMLEAKQPDKLPTIIIDDPDIPLDRFEVIGLDGVSTMSRDSGESREEFKERCRAWAARSSEWVWFFQYKRSPGDIF